MVTVLGPGGGVGGDPARVVIGHHHDDPRPGNRPEPFQGLRGFPEPVEERGGKPIRAFSVVETASCILSSSITLLCPRAKGKSRRAGSNARRAAPQVQLQHARDVEEANASSLSHIRASLNPASSGLPLGDSRRSGTVAYVRADASPNESNRESVRWINLRLQPVKRFAIPNRVSGSSTGVARITLWD